MKKTLPRFLSMGAVAAVAFGLAACSSTDGVPGTVGLGGQEATASVPTISAPAPAPAPTSSDPVPVPTSEDPLGSDANGSAAANPTPSSEDPLGGSSSEPAPTSSDSFGGSNATGSDGQYAADAALCKKAYDQFTDTSLLSGGTSAIAENGKQVKAMASQAKNPDVKKAIEVLGDYYLEASKGKMPDTSALTDASTLLAKCMYGI